MKLDLSAPLNDLAGKPLDENTTMGRTLANALASASTGPAVKFYDWAVKLHNGQPIELDAADKTTLTKFLETTPLSNIARGPILKAIEALK